MPRSDEPDTASTKEQSPEPTPTKESSPSPELVCQGRASEIGESSTQVQTTKCKVEREISAETVDDGESIELDTFSGDSVCSKCGGSKTSKNPGLKPPAQFTCKCHLQKDEARDVGSTSQDLPLADIAAEEISQIDNASYDDLPDLPEETTPEEPSNPITPTCEEEVRNQPLAVECYNISCDFSCENVRWEIVITIVCSILIVFSTFIILLILYFVVQQSATNANVTNATVANVTNPVNTTDID